MSADVRPPAGRLPSVASIVRARLDVELRQFFRERDAVIFIFAYPVIMMVIFGSVFGDGSAGAPGATFAQYFVGGIAATGVMLTSFQSLAITIATERDDGTLKRLHDALREHAREKAGTLWEDSPKQYRVTVDGPW